MSRHKFDSCIRLGAVAHLGERRTCTAKAAGSIPVSSTILINGGYMKLMFLVHMLTLLGVAYLVYISRGK